MSRIIEILSTAHHKLSKLEIKDIQELKELMWALGILNFKGITNRIIEDEEEVIISGLIDREIGFCDSRSELRKLILNNGFKINNQPPPEKFTGIKWLTIDKVEFAILKKGKADFDMIFKNFEL